MKSYANVSGFLCFIVCLFSIFNSLHAQWTKLTVPLNFNTGLAMDAVNKDVAIFAIDDFLYQTLDGGLSWRTISLPMNIACDISMIDSLHFWICGGWPNQIYATSDAGENWQSQYESPQNVCMNYIKMFDLKNGIAMADAPKSTTMFILLKTNDGGNHWYLVYNNLFGAYSGDWWRRIDFINPNVGYFFASGANHNKLYKTFNGGSVWSETNYPDNNLKVLKFYNKLIGIGVSASDKIHRTFDGGNTWESFSRVSQGCEDDIEFCPGDPVPVSLTHQTK